MVTTIHLAAFGLAGNAAEWKDMSSRVCDAFITIFVPFILLFRQTKMKSSFEIEHVKICLHFQCMPLSYLVATDRFINRISFSSFI